MIFEALLYRESVAAWYSELFVRGNAEQTRLLLPSLLMESCSGPSPVLCRLIVYSYNRLTVHCVQLHVMLIRWTMYRLHQHRARADLGMF